METLGNWSPLFSRIVPSKKEVLELIAVIEFLCIEIEKLRDAFHVIIQYLCSEMKIIENEVLIEWHNSINSSYVLLEGITNIDPNEHKFFKDKLEKYVKQLNVVSQS
jgi:hypothetical protein